MGIFDFLKKLFSASSEEKSASENGKESGEQGAEIKFESIGIWISEEKRKCLDQEKSAIVQIKGIISGLLVELRGKNEILQKVSISDKKVEEKIRILVQENLLKYGEDVNKLIESLEKADDENLEAFVGKLNKIFTDFKKKSLMSYEKATILVGKELADIRESINNFLDELNKIINSNKELVKKLNAFVVIENKDEKLKKTEKTRLETISKIAEFDAKILETEEKIKAIDSQAEGIRQSEEYKNEQKEKEKAMLEKEALEKEVFKLKEMIDFKALANILHSSIKKMKLLKSYEENFSQILEKDENELLDLLEEAKRAPIKIKLNEIKEKRKILKEILERKEKTHDLMRDIEKLNAEIKALNSVKAGENKKIEKFEETIAELKDVIRIEMSELGVKVA